MTNHLHIVRGVSGSGKSTLARKLGGYHVEADMYFEDADGHYNFDPSKLKSAHRFCQKRVEGSMAVGEPLIVVSNTFTEFWEILPYIHLAEVHEYKVDITTLTEVYGNIHDVPESVVEKQKNRFVSHAEICKRIQAQYPNLLSEYYDEKRLYC